ncbi:response regulator transcription factor [Oceanispirochaeta crateris]|uniref:Response regulator transcription factor n=1 Tax=Oceanispirochaeta crateris TaxID=2518645 RepID=A0A5C1QJA5_9SPIO|nr:response regulator transcription factor [Oceanispirochaeta crateris]QEN07080.1 response regulator transcription factor [Oceanispirochaeta crateris]
MKARILLIEDEKDIADIIMLYLRKDGMETLWKDTGESGFDSFIEGSFDLIVLDINLPGMDGYEILRKIRQKSQIPVIIVSARQEDVDLIQGFGTGADDYVTKPFSPSVLVARIRAHLRRHEETHSDESPLCEFGDFKLDINRQILTQNEKIVNLSPREMDLLVFLIKQPGVAVSQEDLFHSVWGNHFGDMSTVSVHIRRLRNKLGEDSTNPRYIRTRYGYGYYFQGDGIH